MTKELLQQALEALEPFVKDAARIDPGWSRDRRRDSLTQDKPLTVGHFREAQKVCAAIEQALAQQEQPASVDAYVGAREDAAIWKKRALEAEELNRKFIAELNGPTYLGEPAQQEQPYAHRAIPGLTIDPVTGNVGIEAPKQEQPAQGKCKCGHVGTSITVVESFPVHSVSVDEEDPDYKEHYHGLDVDATLQIGLEICRNCKTINGFWIEDTGGAEFYADWGKPRYTHPATTQPALSDAEILNCFSASKAEGMASYMLAVGRAIEAHCRGGNHG